MENEILSGGLPGLSLLVYRLVGVNPTITQWLVGIPILFLGWFFLGRASAMASLAGSILLPAAIYLSSWLPAIPCENQILAAVFGGLLVGAGLGFVFRANATTGGFSIIARILSKLFGIPIASGILILDGSIILCAAAFFGAEDAMLALLSVMAISKAIDLVQSGLGMVKSVTIITANGDEMKQMLLHKLDCGATRLDGQGAYSEESRVVLITVIPRSKVARLRRNVHFVDPTAFTIISNASEVLGYGFSNHG